jgi:hypothetical protein
MVSMLVDCCRFDDSSSVRVIFTSFDRGRAIRVRTIGVVVMLVQSLTLTPLSVALVDFDYWLF